MSNLAEFLRLGTSIALLLMAVDAIRRQRIFNLSRADETVGYWVFVVGFVGLSIIGFLVFLYETGAVR